MYNEERLIEKDIELIIILIVICNQHHKYFYMRSNLVDIFLKNFVLSLHYACSVMQGFWYNAELEFRIIDKTDCEDK